MVYYTSYTLEWTPQDGAQYEYPRCEHQNAKGAKYCTECGLSNIPKSLEDVIGTYIQSHAAMQYALNEDGSAKDSTKWYDHKEYMIEMSKHFKNVLFKLHGEGEEKGDMWDFYTLNGKSQLCNAEIVIPKYDPVKMK